MCDPVKEVAHFLDHAGPGSLVLVDELGRATSTADGTALAWAVCEALLAAHAPTLFATHFPALSQLAAMYPTARLWQLRVGEHGGSMAKWAGDSAWPQLGAWPASTVGASRGLALFDLNDEIELKVYLNGSASACSVACRWTWVGSATAWISHGSWKPLGQVPG